MLVRHGETVLMIDCGFSVKYVLSRLEQVACPAGNIDAILVTHEHSDHINGVSSLARRFGIPVYATRGTVRTGKLQDVPDLRLLDLDRQLSIGGLAVLPVAVPHDANEPCQFVFEADGKKLGVMTDLGSVSPHVHAAFGKCNALLLEANHDLEMLWGGSYPPNLKHRIASDWGHLSNAQAEQFLRMIDLETLEILVLGHISEQNNSMERVKRHFSAMEQQIEKVIYATQEHGFSWLSV